MTAESTSAHEAAARLRELGLRVTAQRAAVLAVLTRTRAHATATEITEELQQTMPGVTVSTVCRALDAFQDVGLVTSSVGPEGATVYETGASIHHHFVCHVCGASSEIDEAIWQDWVDVIEEKTGFRLCNPHYLLGGICRRCADSQREAAPAG